MTPTLLDERGNQRRRFPEALSPAGRGLGEGVRRPRMSSDSEPPHPKPLPAGEREKQRRCRRGGSSAIVVRPVETGGDVPSVILSGIFVGRPAELPDKLLQIARREHFLAPRLEPRRSLPLADLEPLLPKRLPKCHAIVESEEGMGDFMLVPHNEAVRLHFSQTSGCRKEGHFRVIHRSNRRAASRTSRTGRRCPAAPGSPPGDIER